jgi:hypothetical protein
MAVIAAIIAAVVVATQKSNNRHAQKTNQPAVTTTADVSTQFTEV